MLDRVRAFSGYKTNGLRSLMALLDSDGKITGSDRHSDETKQTSDEVRPPKHVPRPERGLSS